MDRRGFLKVLGLAPAAAVVAPEVAKSAGTPIGTQIAIRQPRIEIDPETANMRFLGLAQPKMEGWVNCIFCNSAPRNQFGRCPVCQEGPA